MAHKSFADFKIPSLMRKDTLLVGGKLKTLMFSLTLNGPKGFFLGPGVPSVKMCLPPPEIPKFVP